jgi:hypothetical protein
LFSILYGSGGASPDADAAFQHWPDLPALLNHT